MSESVRLSIDKLGRILIPAALRSRLGLSPGMTLIIEEGDHGEMRLQPWSESPMLVDKAGILVVRAEPLDNLRNVTRQERDRRVSTILQRTGM